MSNFGRLGSAMVRDGLAAGQYGAGVERRELAETRADLQTDVIDYEREEMGETGYIKMLADQEKLKRQNAQLMFNQKLMNEKAKEKKLNAQAAKAAMGKAHSLTGTSTVPVQRINHQNKTGNR